MEDKIMSTFWPKRIFRREELWRFVRGLDPQIKEARFNYIILDLKKKGKLRDVGKGVYTVGDKVEFQPEPDEMIMGLADFLNHSASLDGGAYDIWTT